MPKLRWTALDGCTTHQLREVGKTQAFCSIYTGSGWGSDFAEFSVYVMGDMVAHSKDLAHAKKVGRELAEGPINRLACRGAAWE